MDAAFAALINRGGVYQYMVNLISEFGKIDAENEYILLSFSFFGSKRPERHDEFCSSLTGNYKRRICRLPRRIWREIPLPIESITGPIDVFHGLIDYVPPTRSAKSILTVHDTAYLRNPELLKARWVWRMNIYTPLIANRADLIITISDFSKYDIVELLGIPEDRVRVVYHGVSPHFVPIEEKTVIEEIKQKHGIEGSYILFVGVLEPRKNITRLIEAFNELKNISDFPHKLVIAGPEGWLCQDIFRKVKEPGLESDIILTGYVPHADLPALYSGADLFILPSVSESFGIPVLEAMACGTPVVGSKACALPEVVGDAGILVDPYSIQDMAEAMYKVLSDSNLQAELRKKGIERVKNFTWEKTAKRTLGIYREVSGI